MRQLLLIALLVLPATAEDLGKTLRVLRLEDRERRREALKALALGEIAPATSGSGARTRSCSTGSWTRPTTACCTPRSRCF
jgi:hypothetical protein